MRKKYLVVTTLLVILLMPFWMWLFWLLTPKKKMVVAIIDKTVVNNTGQEHLSLTWVLNHEKYSKTHSKLYDVSEDYFGFYPKKHQQFRLKGLERFNSGQLDQLSKDCDLTYFTDTYGIDVNEWYQQKNPNERSALVYGGMKQQDVDFLSDMKRRHKLIISEFNTIASPTTDEIRTQFERMFGIRWTGWVCRHFESLDTNVNKQIPAWIIEHYKKDNANGWPFKQAGVIFISNQDEVVILEDRTDLNNPLPYIDSNNSEKNKYNLPASVEYSNWFDIISIDTTVNKIVATFNLNLNTNGANELTRRNIPITFPAVVAHEGNDYRFYYFSGNFSSNPIAISSSYFKGISAFKQFFIKENDVHDTKNFFWNFYKPMLTSILNNYYKHLHH